MNKTGLRGAALLLLSALLLLPASSGAISLEGVLDTANKALSPADSGSGTSSLTNSDIVAGLKEALNKAVDESVAFLGKPGGFLDNPEVRIPLARLPEQGATDRRGRRQGRTRHRLHRVHEQRGGKGGARNRGRLHQGHQSHEHRRRQGDSRRAGRRRHQLFQAHKHDGPHRTHPAAGFLGHGDRGGDPALQGADFGRGLHRRHDGQGLVRSGRLRHGKDRGRGSSRSWPRKRPKSAKILRHGPRICSRRSSEP